MGTSEERARWLASLSRGDVLEIGPDWDPAAGLERADASADTVLVRDVLERSSDPEAVLTEIVRVAKPNAAIGITVHFGHSPDPSQRRALYVSSLLDLLAPVLSIERLDVAGSHFRVRARPGSTAEAERLRILVALQPLLETRFAHAQVEAMRLGQTVARLRRRLARLRRRYRQRVQRSRRMREELRDLRARPWMRARRALGRRLRPRRPSRAPSVASPPNVVIPEFHPPAGPISRPELGVAVILDEFSAAALRYEWRQIEFGPDDWLRTLERDQPRLLFVESAWEGNAGRWAGTMRAEGPSESLRELVAWCRKRGIPTVFWCKEDPPWFSRFLATARLFDHVFTVDGDSIPRYRDALGHDRVGLMQFAAQPRIHNPIAVDGGREHDVAFAGSYFAHHHPTRREQMASVLEPALDAGLHVFSRRLGTPDRDFPSAYAPHVVGSLPYERMLAAYKRYRLFLNVNSVPDSPTMCARRVLELSACATPVLSGPSRAIDEVFGDSVAVARDAAETREQLRRLLGDAELRDRLAHQAMRTVLSSHTYGHRIDAVLRAVGIPVAEHIPTVSVLLATKRSERLTEALRQVGSQVFRPLQLVLVLHGIDHDPAGVTRAAHSAGIDDLVVLRAERSLSLGACLNLALDAADGDLVAKMDDDDLYGQHYLADLVRTFQFVDAPIVGKCAHYAHLAASGLTLLRLPHNEHSYVNHVKGATITAVKDVLGALRFDDARAGVDRALFARCGAEGVKIYSSDRFSFAAVRHPGTHGHTWRISDARLMKKAGPISNAPVESLLRV